MSNYPPDTEGNDGISMKKQLLSVVTVTECRVASVTERITPLHLFTAVLDIDIIQIATIKIFTLAGGDE